jgi:formylglycine-generating enzyme required for sulfatase activity
VWNNEGKSLGRTTTVGSYEPNGFGLYDMHGNVWAWCHDRDDADYYRTGPREGPPGARRGGSARVIRGGCRYSIGPNCRAADRNWSAPSFRNFDRGFRVAQDPSGP